MASEETKARVMETAAAVLAGAPKHRLNTVSFNKALFCADLIALLENGQTITRATYLALPKGPVIASYDRVIKKLAKAGIAEQTTEGAAKPIHLKQAPAYAHLTEAERAIAKEAGALFGVHTSALASRFSHDNIGWRMARDASANGPAPINMLIALQQLDGDESDETWLAEPAGTELLERVSSIDEQELEDW